MTSVATPQAEPRKGDILLNLRHLHAWGCLTGDLFAQGILVASKAW